MSMLLGEERFTPNEARRRELAQRRQLATRLLMRLQGLKVKP